MVAVEIGLYIFIILLIVYFLFIKKPKFVKHSRKYKDLIERKEQAQEQFRKIKQKPLRVRKAHYGLMVFLFIFLFVLLSILLTYLWNTLKLRFVLTDADSVYFNSTWGISFLVFAFISLPLANLIIESHPFKTARYMQSHHYNVPTFSHRTDIKLTLIMLLIVFTIGFPFVILSTDCYSRINNNQFCTNDFFGFEENEYSILNDIDSAELKISYDGDYHFYYNIYFNDNASVDVFDDNLWGIENVVYINSILEKNNIPIKRTDLSLDDWEGIDQELYDHTVSSLKQLYHIE